MINIWVSSIIPTEIERVWAVVRDFNAIPDWHPLIAESRIETGAPSDQIGCIRNFSTTDGGRIREQLLSLSDGNHSFSYCILEADLKLLNYTAGLSLQRVTDGNVTFGSWWAEFNTPPDQEEELSQLVKNEVFQAGFDALKSRFS
ncbi:MAG: SRPBCC family protein [Aestuariivita sp.]|nr:SRPBCC family protein [Aestuariivita sp.]MCY4346672.1 SRPBCC family protein [Aestuariivita sp.]